MSDSNMHPQSFSSHPTQNTEMRIKVFGVGGAGTNSIDRLAQEGVSSAVELVACNTDVQALSASLAAHKIQIGRRITRGLGAGGDPEVGFGAAEEAIEEIRSALHEVPLVLVCAGLGGGTGSGAAPLIVKLAREQGSLVLVCATLPFSFEGKRRGWQAQEALRAIQQHADAVICFENDRMGELISSDSNITEAFAGADVIIGQTVRAVVDLVNRRGLIRLGFDDLFSALRNHDARCLFGYGEGQGDNRSLEALSQAMHSPLMDQGTLLNSAANVLVNIVGGDDLTLSEVHTIMDKLSGNISEHTQLLFGAAIDHKMEGRIGVTVISSLSARGNTAAAFVPSMNLQNMGHATQSHRIATFNSPSISPQEARLGIGNQSHGAATHTGSQTHYYQHHYQPQNSHMSAPQQYGSQAPASGNYVGAGSGMHASGSHTHYPTHSVQTHGHIGHSQGHTTGHPHQSSAPVDPAVRGRFEKSEPTIVDGEDLDVPTFLRKNMQLR